MMKAVSSLFFFLLSSIVRNAFSQEIVEDKRWGSCVKWRVYKNTGISDGQRIQYYLSGLDQCQSVCAAFNDCRGVSFVTKNKTCVLNYPNLGAQTTVDGWDFWEKISLGRCQVDCPEAVREQISTAIDGDADEFKNESSYTKCRNRCLERVNCRGFEWLETSNMASKCRLQKASNNRTKTSKDDSYFEIGRPECAGECIEWVRTINSIQGEGVVQNEAKTEDMCKTKCAMLYPECLSVDWVIKDSEKISPVCYFHYKQTSQLNSPGAVNWKIKQANCSDPAKTANTSIGSCAEWLRISGAIVAQKSYQPDVTTEDMCKKTCMAFPKCNAVDWRPKENEKCNLQEEGIDSVPTLYSGAYYWKIYRDGECQVDCADAIRAKEQSQLAEVKGWEGEKQKYVNTLPECRKACLTRYECIGFGWFDKGPDGGKCTLEFLVNGTTTSNPSTTYYQVGRPLCIETAKKTGTSGDECLKAFVSKEGLKFEDQGERYGDAPAVDDCKRACLAQSRCYGFNWFNSNHERHRCFLQSKASGRKVKKADSAYYQLSAPGSGCRGSCIDWQKNSDARAKKGDVKSHKTENECKFNCILKPRTCQSVDWIEGAKTPCIHHAIGETEELESQTGADNWKLIGVPCTGTCTMLRGVIGIEKKPKEPQAGITTELMCKIKCMAAYPGCQSLDWIKPGACHHHLNGIELSETHNPNAVHWRLIRVSCQETCGEWTETADTKATSGDLLPDISSEDMCRIACMLTRACTSVDWITENGKKCFLQSGASTNEFALGAVHWEFKRKRLCENKTVALPAPKSSTTTTMEAAESASEPPITTAQAEESTTAETTTTTTTTITEAPTKIAAKVTRADVQEATTQGEKKGGSSLIIVVIIVVVIGAVIAFFFVRKSKENKEPKSDEEKKLLEQKDASPLDMGPAPFPTDTETPGSLTKIAAQDMPLKMTPSGRKLNKPKSLPSSVRSKEPKTKTR